MKWRVRYLIHYKDVDRWGESPCASRVSAFEWVRLAHMSFLTVEVYLGPKLEATYKRGRNGALVRVWRAG